MLPKQKKEKGFVKILQSCSLYWVIISFIFQLYILFLLHPFLSPSTYESL